MRGAILLASSILLACDVTCKTDSDCPTRSSGQASICFQGICAAADGVNDGGLSDSGPQDATIEDGGAGPLDAGPQDATIEDGGAGPQDTGSQDAGQGVLGAPCTSPGQCATGYCVDKVCCDSPCNDHTCQRCDQYSMGGSGHCGVAKQGTDLDGECPKPTASCSGKCSIQKTAASCTGSSYTCSNQQETVLVASGSICVANAQVPVSKEDYCNTGSDCADGKCQASRWYTSCDGKGSCRAANDATEAYKEAVIASAGRSLTSSCATDGTVYCGSACVDSGLYWAFCDGASHCTSTSSSKKSDCGIYGCDASSGQCRSPCSADADCASPYLCAAPVCHWNWEWPSWRVSNPRSFTKNSDGTVKDNVTGLVWQQGVSDSGKTWSDAKAYCAGLGLAGGGWRLPTRIELLTIIDVTKYMPAINTGVFSLGASSSTGTYFWSATPAAGGSGSAWRVSFYDGFSFSVGTARGYWVRCVR
jgi:hypothetical protein